MCEHACLIEVSVYLIDVLCCAAHVRHLAGQGVQLKEPTIREGVTVRSWELDDVGDAQE